MLKNKIFFKIIYKDCQLEIDLKQMVSDGYEKVKEQVPKIQQSLENSYEKLKETGPKIKEKFEQGYETLKEQAPKIKQGIENGMDNIKETVKENTPVEVQKTVKSGFEKVKDVGRSFLGFFKRLFGKTEYKKDETTQRFKRQFTVSYEPTGFGKNWNMNAHKFNYNKFSPYLAKKK